MLLAVDGSAPSLLATRFASRLYRQLKDAAVVLVHVHPGGEDGAHEAATRDAREILESDGVPYTLEVGPGDAAELIVERAREHECDLIVLGTRGHGKLMQAVLGSVSAKVAQSSTIPVTLVS